MNGEPWEADFEGVNTSIPASDPWASLDATQTTNPDINFPEDDFASLSVSKCHNLLSSCPNDAEKTTDWIIDKDYLSRLEKRLEKLQKPTKKNERRDMITQMSHRTESLFSKSDGNRQGVYYESIESSSLTRRLFPEKQALTAEELYNLPEHDQLTTEPDVIPAVDGGKTQDAPNNSKSAKCDEAGSQSHSNSVSK